MNSFAQSCEANMGIAPFIGFGILAAAIAATSEPHIEIESKWKDDVGKELKKQADTACHTANASIKSCQNAFEKVKMLKPAEFHSEAENYNNIVLRINETYQELNRLHAE